MIRALKVILTALIIGLIFPGVVLAHSPHDAIAAIQLSSMFNIGAVIFAIVRGNLLYSLDAGLTWLRLMRGIGATSLNDIVLSPDYPVDKVAYVASDGEGVFCLDHTMAWKAKNHNLTDLHISSMAISPNFGKDRKLVALGRHGNVYITYDGGECWQRVATVGKLATCATLCASGAILGTSIGEVYSLKNDAMDLCIRLPSAERITTVAAVDSAGADMHVYIGTVSGKIWVYDLTAMRLMRCISLPSSSPVTSIALKTDRAGTIDVFAATWEKALFRTDNRGSPVNTYDEGLSTNRQADELGQPHFKGICVSSGFAEDRTVFLGGFDGLFKSTDGGCTWAEMREVLSIGIIVGLDLCPLSKECDCLSYTTYGSGAYVAKSIEKANWKASHFGSSKTRLFDIVYSPDYQKDSTLFSVCNSGLLISRDGGEHWEEREFLFPRHGRGAFKAYLLSFARRAQRLLSLMIRTEKLNALKRFFHFASSNSLKKESFGWGSQIAISPGFALDNTLFVVSAGGIVRSTDGGESFELVWNNKSNEIIRFAALSPYYEFDGQIFALGSRHVFFSSDRGDTWQAIGSNEEWRFECLAISPDFKRDRTLFAGGKNSGFVRSNDGGKSWKQLSQTEDGWVSARNIFVSPSFRDDREVFIQTYGSGLFRSRDAGDSFFKTEVDSKVPDVSFSHLNGFPDRSLLLKFSPGYKHNRNIYAACMSSLYQSCDGGDTWKIRISAPVRYEAARCEIRTLPPRAWQLMHDRGFSAMTAYSSEYKGASAVLDFVGIGVRWIASRGPNHGIAEVFIDGEYVQSIDLYGPCFEAALCVFEIYDLPFQQHTITVSVKQSSNERASGERVVVNAFDVIRERALP